MPFKMAADVVTYAAGDRFSVYITTDGSLIVRGQAMRGESGTGDLISSFGLNGSTDERFALIRSGYYKTFTIQPQDQAGPLPVIDTQPAGGVYP